MQKLTIESVISGTVGALAMMPVGFLFRALEMRVVHYGPKFAALYLQAPGPLALFLQHLVLGWVSESPLLAPFMYCGARAVRPDPLCEV